MSKLHALLCLPCILVQAQELPANQKKESISIILPEGKKVEVEQFLGVASSTKTGAFSGAMRSTFPGPKADAVVAMGFTEIRLEKINPREVPGLFTLIKLKTEGQDRFFEIKISGSGSELGQDFIVFKAKEMPRPMKNSDGSYSIKLPAPLAKGHYCLSPELSPGIFAPFWDFTIE